MIHILAVSGSLRAGSFNTTLLRCVARLAPPGVEVVLYEGIGSLPHFNPDLEDPLPAVVADFRSRIGAADGLMICSPEYAHGVPGVLKNALDWLVSGPEFIGKPVVILSASPRATFAQASLIETITVMSGRIVAEASVALQLRGRNLDIDGIVTEPEMAAALRQSIAAFVRAIRHPEERSDEGS